jgi:hypothetical protein
LSLFLDGEGPYSNGDRDGGGIRVHGGLRVPKALSKQAMSGSQEADNSDRKVGRFNRIGKTNHDVVCWLVVEMDTRGNKGKEKSAIKKDGMSVLMLVREANDRSERAEWEGEGDDVSRARRSLISFLQFLKRSGVVSWSLWVLTVLTSPVSRVTGKWILPTNSHETQWGFLQVISRWRAVLTRVRGCICQLSWVQPRQGCGSFSSWHLGLGRFRLTINIHFRPANNKHNEVMDEDFGVAMLV